MTKAVILCFDFPPYNSVGAHRPYSWFKYLRNNGVEPVVITRHWSENVDNELAYFQPSSKQEIEVTKTEEGEIIRVPYKPNIRDRFVLRYGLQRFKIIRKFLSFIWTSTRLFTFKFDNTANIYYQADEYIKNNKCDMLIATSEPFVLFRYAAILSKKHDIPWVADYRDGWSTNYGNNYASIFQKLFINLVIRPIEKKYLNSVKVITTVSDSHRNDLDKLHKNIPVEIVHNGYDFAEIDQGKTATVDPGTFEIAYAGTIYPYQELEIFLEGYRDFILETNCTNTKAVFYGLDFYPNQKQRLFSFSKDVNEHLTSTLRIPHKEVIPKLRNASLLLLLANDTFDGSCAKIFEYLALNRKIILVKDDHGSLSRIMDECDGGVKCSSSREVTDSLKRLYTEFNKEKYLPHQSKNYDRFSRSNQAGILADLVRKHVGVIAKSSPKALILAHDFPPYNSIGAQRPHSWYKYFKNSDIYPVVITRHWDENIKNQEDYVRLSSVSTTQIDNSDLGTIIRAPYISNVKDHFILKYGLNKLIFIRKILSFSYAWGRFITTRMDSTAHIYWEAEKYIRSNPCSVIIATGEPFILFNYASHLSKKYNIPWIADYRDGWTTNFANKYIGFFTTVMNNVYYKPLEKRYLKTAHLITTTAPPYKKSLQALRTNKPIKIVYNGYDPEVIESLGDIQQSSDTFEIAYSGTIYPHQQLEMFLEGYLGFIKTSGCTNTRTTFYGLDFFKDQKVRLHSYSSELASYLYSTERLPHKKALKGLKSANLLLLLADKNTEQLAAKVFEYLTLDRKIILVADDHGILSNIMDTCNGGDKCETVNDVTAALMHAYELFKKEGNVEHQARNYEQYNRRAQAIEMTKLVKECVE